IPAFDTLTDLMQMDQSQRGTPEWHESFIRAIDIVGGFTAVDGATVLTRDHTLLAFGAKVARASVSAPAEEVMMTEPVAGVEPTIVHPRSEEHTSELQSL